MLVDTFANRLKKALNKAGLNQTQLAEKTKIDKSLISNYLAGNYNAKQDKLTLIANVLDVDETWLMGFDVPEKTKISKININKVNTDELILLLEKNIDKLTSDDKGTIEYIIKNRIKKDKESKNKESN
jgi:transcriptional regulator with XRE-family HTH domain